MPERNNEETQLESIYGTIFIVFWIVGLILFNLIFEIELSDTVLLSIIIFPPFFYFILSGRLLEFKGPGGIEAKFKDVSKKPIEKVTEIVKDNLIEYQFIDKRELHILNSITNAIDVNKPILFRFILNGNIIYDLDILHEYLGRLYQFKNFEYAVFVESNNKLITCIKPNALKELLSDFGENFIEVLNNQRKDKLIKYPNMINEKIKEESLIIEALKLMDSKNLDSLIVLNKEDIIAGLIYKEQIISKILISTFE